MIATVKARVMPWSARANRGPLLSILSVAVVTGATGWLLTHQADWDPWLVVAGLLGYALLGSVVAVAARLRRLLGFGVANQVTLLRAGLVCLVGGALLAGGGAPALGWSLAALIALALTLDLVDGWLARRRRLVSDFGARFDLETDALLLLILALLAWQTDRVGPWVLAIGLLRYAFALAGWRLPWLRRPLPPSGRRKQVCAVQGVTLLLCLLPPVDPMVAGAAAALALIALLTSFAIDLRWLAAGELADGARLVPDGAP